MIIPIRTALGASATAFPLTDSLFEFLREPSTVEIGVAADANGVLATISIGTEVIVEENPVSLKTINVMPVYPDDFVSDAGLPDDKIVIKLRDTSAAARVVMTQVRITPIVG